MKHIDKQWINRAEGLWHHPVTQQDVDHSLAMADERHQDEIRGKADWRQRASDDPQRQATPWRNL